MKTCYRCKESKDLSCFSKNKSNKHGIAIYCKICKAKYQREYRIKNREKIRACEIKSSKKPESIKKSRDREKSNYKNNIQFNLAYKLRRRFNIVLKKGFVKYSSAVKDLGCSLEEFKEYFESKFSEGMTWEYVNCGKIHIDHIKPLSKFDLTSREEQLKALHYTNLQPLWAIDNILKKDNYEH